MKKITFNRLFFRTFFIQSLWNFERLQNIGFLYILYPVLKKLYPDKEKRKEVLLRHIGFFNTHPYMANIIIPMVINCEISVAEGNKDAVKKVDVIKNIMSGPVAAIGDSFFWGTWRPFASFLSIGFIILSARIFKFEIDYIFAPVIFILSYNVVHIAFRYWILFISFKLDDKMINLISKLEIKFIGDMVRMLGLTVIVSSVFFYFDIYGFMPTNFDLLGFMIPEALLYGIVLLAAFLFGKVRPVIMFYCALLFSFTLGYLGL